ncbi:MAG TPA: hypothetical protein DCZ10_01460, partial [Pelotomaculum sp.]|nr:hypothetical protein [Pelotomaculum sp.]
DWQTRQGVVKVRMSRMLPEQTAGGSFGAVAVNPVEDVVAFIAGANGYRWIFTTYYEGGAPYLYDSYENKDLPEDEETAESEYTLSWSSDGQRLYFHKVNSGAARTALYFLEPGGMVSPVARDGNSKGEKKQSGAPGVDAFIPAAGTVKKHVAGRTCAILVPTV